MAIASSEIRMSSSRHKRLTYMLYVLGRIGMKCYLVVHFLQTM